MREEKKMQKNAVTRIKERMFEKENESERKRERGRESVRKRERERM